MREARGENVEPVQAEVEAADETVGKKRKSKPSAKAQANKKQKTSTTTSAPAPSSAAPPRMPQSKLITGGTLKDYQIDGMNWIIERYIFALFGAIVSLSLALFELFLRPRAHSRSSFLSSPTRWVRVKLYKLSRSSLSFTKTSIILIDPKPTNRL